MKLRYNNPPRSEKELLERYSSGERDFRHIQLDERNYDFRNAVLEGINFSFSYITADFRGANLKNANFKCANIKTCDFRNADLEGANLSEAALDSTSFEGANLDGAIFSGATNHSLTLTENEKPWW